ncbi:unnamed protein product [Ectocarpus sp. CCAP 1310/34]|nr:unnamed protein product [Ectocarpus sp. CCAP 1310/34]
MGRTATRVCTKRSGSSLVVLGLATAAPEQRNRSRRTASNRGARANISCVVKIFFPLFS